MAENDAPGGTNADTEGDVPASTNADTHGDAANAAPTRRTWRFIGIVGTALILAAVTAIGTDIGSGFVGLFEKTPTWEPQPGTYSSKQGPVTYSVREVVDGCGTELFIPEQRATSVLANEPPADPTKWGAFKRSQGASPAGYGAVLLSIQGESTRKITLTGIHFSAERRERPEGATFANPCGEPLRGRQLVADLDANPIAVIAVSRSQDGVPADSSGSGQYEPQVFPWTVSITDPLLLRVEVTTKRCYCIWRAELPWQSGNKSGLIRVDGGGEGYPVVGEDGLKAWVSGAPAWRPSARSRSE